jgi:hypothetical protein
MPAKKKSRASEGNGLRKGNREPITDAEITQCLEMEREIVGRVELLEPDHGMTVYFLVSTKSNVKQSLWYVNTFSRASGLTKSIAERKARRLHILDT